MNFSYSFASSVLAGAAALLLASPASAADWGSFDGSRMAYMAGALSGTAHSQLRGVIEAEGDTVAAATPTLTTEYLDTVDVFYTSMLYAGTGGASGDTLGTLSNDEAEALDAWLAAGGTLILTVDSTGLAGDDFETIYNSWGTSYGIGGFAFDDSGPVSAAPLVEHPITTDVETYEWVNRTTFTVGDDALLLGYSAVNVPFMAVLEPETGFAIGGRILVIGDHNIFANSGFSFSDNPQLAANIAAWANGECGNTLVEAGEECDDGNNIDDDACTNACLEGESETTDGTSTGGDTESSTGGDSSSGSSETGSTGERETESTGPGNGTTTGEVTDTTDATETGEQSSSGPDPDPAPTPDPQPTESTSDGETDTEGAGQDDEGGCRVAQGGSPGSLWLLLGLGAFVRRRRRS